MTVPALVHQGRAPATRDADRIVIGKDILELVSSAMYLEPLTVYREYLQNSADAIDDARRSGVLGPGEPGRVEITLDGSVGVRAVRVRDNGSGIPAEEFLVRLRSFGASGKRGTDARGFRGVGRLSGLGFAQELIFRSRAAGEDTISELRWDCRRLRAALRRTEDDGLEGLVLEITTAAERQATADDPPHFFEVELAGVDRHGGAKLLSAEAVENYIRQVAPLPFSPEFTLGAEIRAALGSRVRLAELEVTVNGDGPLFRPHRDRLSFGDKGAITFEAPTILEIEGVEGDVAAVAWFLHHEYEGALPNASLVKGLRLRAGNVQIGEQALLEDLFAEPRFNAWSVGEIHILDRRLIPNGRRDHFEQNVHLTNLLNQLAPTVRDIARRCRISSARRKWLREFDLQHDAAVDRLSILEQGSLPAGSRTEQVSAVQDAIVRMEKLVGPRMLALEGSEDLEARIEALRLRVRPFIDGHVPANPLRRLPKAKREIYEEVFALIYDVASSRASAKALVDRMVARLLPDG